MQPNNTNLPSIQRTLLTPDNGQAALHERMLMYCDKSLTTDKRCGYTKIRHGCIVVMIYACTSSCTPGKRLSLMLRCGNMIGWLAHAESTVNNRILGPELQVAMAEISSHVSGYRPCIWGSNDSRARLTELEFSVYEFFIAGRLHICTLHQLPHRF